ncbi:hypothetical protein UZ36_05630 [Candidatus Nitromaritima sp. SCGC AAA799-C22]|nr:hypothetical protein UZ36_05630 [Candidatus Nitromaritima sp. SCGC AAA799-C22]
MNAVKRKQEPTMRYSIFIVLVALMIAVEAGAQMKTEIITLNHRSVQEMIPVIKPLVGPQGVVTGMNGKLVVKTTPRNLKTIKDVLSKLDGALRNLKITVRQGRLEDLRETDISVSAEVPVGKRGRVEVNRQGGVTGSVRGGDSNGNAATVRGTFKELESRRDRTSIQHVVTMEGRPAIIHIAQIVPFQESRSVVSGGTIFQEKNVKFMNVTTGFRVLPRLQDDRVFVEIEPVLSELREGRQIETQSVSTTLTGRLGEWIDMGGILKSGDISSRGLADRTGSTRRERRSFYLKVEEQR